MLPPPQAGAGGCWRGPFGCSLWLLLYDLLDTLSDGYLAALLFQTQPILSLMAFFALSFGVFNLVSTLPVGGFFYAQKQEMEKEVLEAVVEHSSDGAAVSAFLYLYAYKASEVVPFALIRVLARPALLAWPDFLAFYSTLFSLFVLAALSTLFTALVWKWRRSKQPDLLFLLSRGVAASGLACLLLLLLLSELDDALPGLRPLRAWSEKCGTRMFLTITLGLTVPVSFYCVDEVLSF